MRKGAFKKAAIKRFRGESQREVTKVQRKRYCLRGNEKKGVPRKKCVKKFTVAKALKQYAQKVDAKTLCEGPCTFPERDWKEKDGLGGREMSGS